MVDRFDPVLDTPTHASVDTNDSRTEATKAVTTAEVLGSRAGLTREQVLNALIAVEARRNIRHGR